MDLFNIPGDPGKPYRRKVVQGLLRKDYIDGAMDYCLLVPYADVNDLSISDKMWLSYLYGLSYSCTTAIRLFEASPEVNRGTIKSLESFWRSEKPTLYFNHDKRYLKNNDQVLPAVESLIKDLDGRSFEYLFLESSKYRSDFESLYRHIKQRWRFFGPMGAYLFFDAVYGLCPDWYVDPDQLDWKNCGKTVVEGMAHMLYQDDLIESRDFPLDKYNRIVEKLQATTGQPKVLIESVLCAFRKYFKGTRYEGYYADRQLEECLAVDALKGINTKVDVWYYRQETIPKALRGEDHDWSGIRKERMHRWLERGKP